MELQEVKISTATGSDKPESPDPTPQIILREGESIGDKWPEISQTKEVEIWLIHSGVPVKGFFVGLEKCSHLEKLVVRLHKKEETEKR